MSNPQKARISVGILGGGQLARMLVIEGHKMGLEMHVLSNSPKDPAALVTRHWHQGDINNLNLVKNFIKIVDLVTFESEFISAHLASDRDIQNAKHIVPRIEIITELADRYKQKLWLEKYKISTSAFSELLNKNDVYSFLNHKTTSPIAVFKKRLFGYDGYGTFILKDKKQIESWLNKNSTTLSDYIIEDYVKFRRELAIQIAINAKKEVTVFPLVEWQAEDSKCLWVKGPTQTKKLSAILKKIIHALKDSHYIGLIAFEFFETATELLVNEVAPRVHNSGHYSLEALALNQFSAHLRAITNQPLPRKPHTYAEGFAMLNLIGSTNQTPLFSSPDNASLHWYAKEDNRKGRKMGHLTALAGTSEQALSALMKIKKGYKI